jgi:hypothetical protein
MKKFTLLFAFLSLIAFGNAQTSKISGLWLMTKAEVNGKVQEPYFITNYRNDGKMLVMDMEAGSWEYNKEKNAIEMQSKLDKDFNGESKIIKLTEKEMVVSKDGARFTYIRVNPDAIKQGNASSGLLGTWVFKDLPYSDVTTFLFFKKPNEFSIVEKDNGSETRMKGTWIYNKEEASLIMMGLRGEDSFKGLNKVVKLDENTLSLEFGGQVHQAVKQQQEQNTTKVVHLTYTEDDFYTADGDYKYDDADKLPWQDPYAFFDTFADVQQLVYKYSKLVDEPDVFENKILKADVEANEDEESLSVDYIFKGYDRYNLPEDTQLPPNTKYTAPLYPEHEYDFRVAGTETIHTPAGSFDCTVIEAIGDFDTAIKLWMINDKPGIYAKIIKEQAGDFGFYVVYELQEIK